MTDPNCTTLTKRCTHCGKVKPATPEFFARQKIGKYGLRADCKECHYEREKVNRAARRKQAKKHIESIKATHRADPTLCERPEVLRRCIKCKEEFPSTTQFFHRNSCLREGLSEFCKKCIKSHHEEYNRRPDIIERSKEYRSRPDIKQRTNEYLREYYKRPYVKERLKQYKTEYYKRPDVKEKQRQYQIEYNKRPEVISRVRANHHRRRNAPGSFTAADIEDIRKAQGNRCYICGKKLKKYHVDHFIPIALGGTNDPGNLRLACPHCNYSKNKKHPHAIGILI